MFSVCTESYRSTGYQRTPVHPESFTAALLAIHLGSLLLLLSGMAASMAAAATPSQSDDREIEYLVNYIRESDMTFIRNFSRHTPDEAASHILDKFQHFRNKIDTPEDFIDLCATESLVTGRDYLVIDDQGRELRTHDWLMDALTDYRNKQSQASAK